MRTTCGTSGDDDLHGGERLWSSGLSRRSSLGVLAGGLAAGLVPAAAHALSAPPAPTWPGAAWTSMTPAAAGFNPALLQNAVKHAASKGGAGFVVRSGWRIASWGKAAETFDIKSATKGLGGMLLGLALGDGRLSLSDTAISRLPEFGLPPSSNARTGWLPQVTLTHLASYTSGFAEVGGFEPLLYRPGAYTYYGNCGPNWLADILTVTFGADLWQVAQQRILNPIGVSTADLTWRTNMYRPSTLRGIPRREIASGIHVNAPALARVGLLLLRGGWWSTSLLLPAVYTSQAFQPLPGLATIPQYKSRRNKPGELSFQWMFVVNNSQLKWPSLPRDAWCFWGMNNNHLMVIPSCDLVLVRLGSRNFGDNDASVNTLFTPFVHALG